MSAHHGRQTGGKNGTFRMDPEQLYKISDVINAIVVETVAPGAPFIVRTENKSMSQIDEATDTIKETTKRLTAAHGQLMAKTTEIGEQAKKTGGVLRDAHQKLADGIERINKSADFARLERQVELLERAAAAMQTLADLDKTGHLVKFAQAVK